MKHNYHNPIVEIIAIAYGDIETLFTMSSERGDEGRELTYQDILNGAYGG